jgi:F0F1-type ATP synthase membrane subunit a
MFFVVLLYNILGLVTDFIAPIFGYDVGTWAFSLAKYLWFATWDYHFNIAMAIIGVIITLVIQFMSLWTSTILGWVKVWKLHTWFVRVLNFIYEYIPFWWKGIVTIDRWSMNNRMYYPAWIVVKLFDIVISLFVGFLDIIWIWAKVISLAFRLFWNMLSWTALLTVLVVSLNAATQGWIWVEFPILAPILLFVQGLLVACIQAFVFPLLIAIFIKVARMSSDDDTQPATA